VIGKGARTPYDALARQRGVADRLVWLGPRADFAAWSTRLGAPTLHCLSTFVAPQCCGPATRCKSPAPAYSDFYLIVLAIENHC